MKTRRSLELPVLLMPKVEPPPVYLVEFLEFPFYIQDIAPSLRKLLIERQTLDEVG